MIKPADPSQFTIAVDRGERPDFPAAMLIEKMGAGLHIREIATGDKVDDAVAAWSRLDGATLVEFDRRTTP